MRLLPRFREERILREEVKLVYQNYLTGILGYYFATVISTIILHQVSHAEGIFYWLTASTFACFIILFRYWSIKDKETIAKTEGLNGPQITGIVLGSLSVVSIVVFIVVKNKKKNKVVNDKLENNVPTTLSSNQSTSSEDSTIVSPPHPPPPPQASQKDGLPAPSN